MALSLGIDQSFVNITFIKQEDTPAAFDMAEQQTGTKTTTVTYVVSPSSSGGDGLSSLGDLTNAWKNMKSSFGDLPISQTDASREIGTPKSASNSTNPESPSTPVCLTDCPCEGSNCPKPSKSSATPIIVGVVVGVVAVILLFVLTIVLVRYCRKNQKACFKPTKNNENDNAHLELGSEVSTAHNSSTKSATKTKSKSDTKKSETKSATADLVEITDHGENLPAGWSKHQHAVTGQVMYVNQEQMISQKHSPLDANGGESAW